MSHQIKRVDAQRRAFAEDRGELAGRIGRLAVVAAGVAEIVLLPQFAEAAEIVEEQVDGRGLFVARLLTRGQLGGEFADDCGRVAHAGDLHSLRHGGGQTVPEADLRGVGTHAVEDVERGIGDWGLGISG